MYSIYSLSLRLSAYIHFLLKPLKEDKFVIPKSRYDSVDCYLASPEYNDVEVIYDKDVFQQLKDGGKFQLFAVRLFVCKFQTQALLHCIYIWFFFMFVGLDDLLAQHIAHLFIRDPISLFAEKVQQDAEKDTDHFEVSFLCLCVITS